MQTLGEFIRKKRDEADLSLRELARRLEITAPYLSDIELGRRFPSDAVRAKIASFLNIPIAELEKFDTRSSITDLKRFLNMSPSLGVAFRNAVDDVNEGKMSLDELAKKLKPDPGKNEQG
jgi:transcriptional regulator with XRE-family HTH domain